jgi:hypothetical protein
MVLREAVLSEQSGRAGQRTRKRGQIQGIKAKKKGRMPECDDVDDWFHRAAGASDVEEQKVNRLHGQARVWET